MPERNPWTATPTVYSRGSSRATGAERYSGAEDGVGGITVQRSRVAKHHHVAPTVATTTQEVEFEASAGVVARVALRARPDGRRPGVAARGGSERRGARRGLAAHLQPPPRTHRAARPTTRQPASRVPNLTGQNT